jgi:hypothetical protein
VHGRDGLAADQADLEILSALETEQIQGYWFLNYYVDSGLVIVYFGRNMNEQGIVEQINPERINVIFRDCLFREGEEHQEFAKGEGIVVTAGFHPERLARHRPEIEATLALLPDQFREDTGGGWSFLEAFRDKYGRQWTGMHQRMDQLFTLGNALGRVEFLLPRALWSSLPGGMPYLVIKKT